MRRIADETRTHILNGPQVRRGGRNATNPKKGYRLAAQTRYAQRLDVGILSALVTKPPGREHPNGRLGNAATTLVSFDPKRESDTLRVSVHPEMDGPERAFNPSSKNHRKGGHERRHDPSEWTCARRQSTCMRIPFLPYRALSECRSSPRRKWFQPTHGRAWRRGDEDQRTRLIEEHARPIDPRLHAQAHGSTPIIPRPAT